MNLSNPYLLSVIAGVVVCLLLYLNNRMTDPDMPLTQMDYLKAFVAVAIIVFATLSLGCSPKSKSGKASGGGLINERFNTGNPGF